MTHPTIVATAHIHLLRVTSGLLCARCLLRGGRDYYLAETGAQRHLNAHRTAGHPIPEVTP